MPDLSGQMLGPYQLLEPLGSGGMAAVFKAYQASMDRYVAIKVVREDMFQQPGVRERFEREVRTIARLEHRYILPVYDFGEDDGIPYLVMRYTDSGSLDGLLQHHRLTTEQALRLVGQVGEALAYAHRHSIIHRDIKPANILTGPDGNALLTDFGIAKILEGATQLTMTGMLIGTPSYMAPEQIQGQPVDGRTDLYALGVVLYECLVGKRPFEAETPLAVALMHVNDPLPPPRQINPALPEAWERVLLKALAKDPEARYQSADEMVYALEETRAQPAVSSEPVTVTAMPPAPEPRVIAENEILEHPLPPPSQTTPASSSLPASELIQSATEMPEAPVSVPEPSAPSRSPVLFWVLTVAYLGLTALFFSAGTDEEQLTVSLLFTANALTFLAGGWLARLGRVRLAQVLGLCLMLQVGILFFLLLIASAGDIPAVLTVNGVVILCILVALLYYRSAGVTPDAGSDSEKAQIPVLLWLGTLCYLYIFAGMIFIGNEEELQASYLFAINVVVLIVGVGLVAARRVASFTVLAVFAGIQAVIMGYMLFTRLWAYELTLLVNGVILAIALGLLVYYYRKRA